MLCCMKFGKAYAILQARYVFWLKGGDLRLESYVEE